jgi:hypothetical protein
MTTQVDFNTFIMSLASSAYCSLGIVENPISKKIEKNLVSAKQQIDLIVLLKEKTNGNLNSEESKTLDSVLFQLKSAYIKLINN